MFSAEHKLKAAKFLVLSGLLSAYRRIVGHRHIILSFHKVRPENLPPNPFDTCPSVSVGAFRQILIFLKRHYQLVSLKSLLHRRDETKPLAAITFDDGWRETYEVAFPILRELEVPATVFVTTGKIGSDEPFWQQALGIQFSDATAQVDSDERRNLERLFGLDNHTPTDPSSYLKMVEMMKKTNISDAHKKILFDWYHKTYSEKRRLFLSLEEIQKMSKFGVDFGSHTVTHVILTTVSERMAETELRESKKTLEEMTGNRIDMLAYPNGGVSQKIINIAGALGYKIGCTTHRSPIAKRDDPLKLPRVEADWDGLQSKNGTISEALIKWVAR